MFFPIVSEQLIHRFKFWANGKICEGMRQGKELYSLVSSFPIDRRQQAYSLGIDLYQHGKQIVMTCSKEDYSVWAVLRSQPTQAIASTYPFRGHLQPAPLISDPNHPAIGKRYTLGSTNHPQASSYQGQACKIVEVWQRWDNALMVSVQFSDETTVRGLFLCELEDTQGRQISKLDDAFKQGYGSVRLYAAPHKPLSFRYSVVEVENSSSAMPPSIQSISLKAPSR